MLCFDGCKLPPHAQEMLLHVRAIASPGRAGLQKSPKARWLDRPRSNERGWHPTCSSPVPCMLSRVSRSRGMLELTPDRVHPAVFKHLTSPAAAARTAGQAKKTGRYALRYFCQTVLRRSKHYFLGAAEQSSHLFTASAFFSGMIGSTLWVLQCTTPLVFVLSAQIAAYEVH